MRKHNPRQLHISIPDPKSFDVLGTIGKIDSMMIIPKFRRALWYLVLLSVLVFATVGYMVTWYHGTALKEFGVGKGWSNPGSIVNTTIVVEDDTDGVPVGVHPIEHLMDVATKRFEKMVQNEIHTLEQAAAQYRKLRGRHPPPGFDVWYKYAKAHDVVINERFWDQIYHDLSPFWSLEPVVLREQVNVFFPKMLIRGGRVKVKSPNEYPKLGLFRDMFTTLTNDPFVALPDIDIPMNINDEPAMLVPWEAIDTALSKSRGMMLPPTSIVSNFSGLATIDELTKDYAWKPDWLGPRRTHPGSHFGPRPLWSLVRLACPPYSEARKSKVFNDIWDPEGEERDEHEATALLPVELPESGLNGYVSNWTNAADACQHPNLQGLHSAFISPKDMNVVTKIFPLFSDRNFSISNDIILPSTEDFHTSNTSSTHLPWSERDNKLYWRSKSTSAHDPQRYWRRFQRERLISMLNATHIEIAEAAIHTGNESTVGVGYARNFRLLPANQCHLKTQTGGKLVEWVNDWSDAVFTDLECTARDDCNDFLSTLLSSHEGSERAKFCHEHRRRQTHRESEKRKGHIEVDRISPVVRFAACSVATLYPTR
jgi:hypothetical protein